MAGGPPPAGIVTSQATSVPALASLVTCSVISSLPTFSFICGLHMDRLTV